MSSISTRTMDDEGTREIKDETLHISNSDAIQFIKSLPEQSIQCVICDPPFGLDEDTFDKHYARNSTNVIGGYQTAPSDAKLYEEWAKKWIHEIPRVLKPDGTVYIVCSWNHVCDIELAIRSSPGLSVVNHIIWKYNFGVYTQKKFVSSHYHILRCAVGKRVPAFYNTAYFNETDKTSDGHSAQYADMEDVWIIPKEMAPGKKKNVNKLPDSLVRKMILYSSKPGDWVADFFLGNFTTAYVARKEGRKVIGCEINEHTYKEHAKAVLSLQLGANISPNKASTKPKNAGRRLSEEEKKKICDRYDELHKEKTKRDSMLILEKEFERGHFSLINLLKAAGR
jgi:site-specific DNA-methyltransferase (adenine-specific)